MLRILNVDHDLRVILCGDNDNEDERVAQYSSQESCKLKLR